MNGKVLLVSVLLVLASVSSIHEDEVGLRDFILRFAGNVTEAVVAPTDTPKNVFVRSEEGAVAAIATGVEGGLNLTWRQLYTEKPLCIAASRKSVVVVGERGSVYVLNQANGEVETTYVLSIDAPLTLAACAVEREAVSIVTYSNKLSVYRLDLSMEEEMVNPTQTAEGNLQFSSLTLSSTNILASSATECLVISLADTSVTKKHSFPCQSGTGEAILSVQSSGVFLYKDGEKSSEVSCTQCGGYIGAQVPTPVIALQEEKKVVVQFDKDTRVTVTDVVSAAPPTVLLTFVMGENTYALVKGGNLHLYLLSTEKLIWERKEGLSNPSAVVIVDPLKDADHFHFNMHVLAVSRSGVLYSIPLQDMGASVKVISDFSAEIPKVTGGVPVLLHHFEHIALKDEVAYITSTYDNNGKKLFCTTKVNLKTNELTGFETFPDALAVSPTHSISNQLEVFGEKLEEMYFYVVDEKSGDVKGFKVVGDKAEPAWTVKLRHPIVSHAKGTHERSHFVNSLHVFPNRTGEEPVEEVRHRYPTHNVIALTHYEVLEGELPALVVTAIDAITGSVLGTVRHKSVEGDVRIVVVENNIVYYFMDAEKMRYLIGVWELFEEETGGIVRKSTGASPPQVIASFFSNNDRTYSSKTLKPPVIVPSTLGVQGGPLAAMGVTTSVNGIARKNIVLVFESGRVALVELRFLLSGGQMPFPTDKDRQITHVIIPSILLASHRYRLASPTGVVSEPTHLESSCHLVVSGLDLFYVRASSGKPFDLLNPDFNKSLLISLVCGFAFLSFVARYFVTRAKVNSKWK